MQINNQNTIEHRGYIIFQNEYNGMYWTYTHKGKITADTLQGLKNMICEMYKGSGVFGNEI